MSLKWVVLRDPVEVVPLDDLRPHDTGFDCWCHPRPDDEFNTIAIHNSMDRREHTTEKGKVV